MEGNLMRVLSLFDGISCGYQALKELGFEVDVYYASEIDKYAIEVAKNNHPDIIELGDINLWKDWNIDFSKIDLVIGGSPCQGFTFAGKRLNFDDDRSKLFFVFFSPIFSPPNNFGSKPIIASKNGRAYQSFTIKNNPSIYIFF